ncbi:MAG: TonB-dependent receptor [Rhodocyclaceae bacterium]|nr:TonB-dependent receptor [Rhodocyclaceae bacterium]
MREQYFSNSAVLIGALASAIQLAYAAPAAQADPPPPTQQSADDAEPQKVIIRAEKQNETDQRRSSTASKLIFGREELDRNGDSAVTEILKRLPGVTMGGRPGRGGGVRMRGLGNGYTQILLNGERPPAGFSLDTLPPDQVERIEVIRGTVAEFSTQAVAGTINIVLREGYKQAQTQWRVSDSMEAGNHSPNISVTHSGDAGALNYSLTASAFQNIQVDDVLALNLTQNTVGAVLEDQSVAEQSKRRRSGVNVGPRINYRFDNGDTLMFQAFVVSSRTNSDSKTLLTEPVGISPYAFATSTGTNEGTFARGFGNYQHKIDGGARLEIKFGLGQGKSDASTTREQFDAAHLLLRTLLDTNNSSDSNLNFAGKYSSPLGDGHTFAAGWDSEFGKRAQQKISLANGLPRFAGSGDDYDSQSRKLAAFVQDEWDISKTWATYFGLRWEGVETKSDSNLLKVKNTSSVFSPVLHGVWRLPELSSSGRDQIRLSLTKSYRPPTLADLIALPSLADVNTPVTPDRTGNPALKPELATGLDFAFEHYLGRSGVMSAGMFRREISDLIRRDISLQNDPSGSLGPRWVSAPRNIGKATTSGIELEAKCQLSDFMTDAPAVDLRANYSRFWSKVDSIPGPNNRLDQQAKQTANLGLDYRLAHLPLTLGGSLNWTPAYLVQSSATQSASVGVKRQFDLYGLWKFTPNAQLRLSANNALAADSLSGSQFVGTTFTQTSSVVAQTYTVWSLRLEIKI